VGEQEEGGPNKSSCAEGKGGASKQYRGFWGIYGCP